MTRALNVVFPGAHITRVAPVTQQDVFIALWRAHAARATARGDHALAVTASTLLDAARRLPNGALFAAEVVLSDTPHAVWIDSNSGAVLGIASPAHIYLAGI